MTRWIQLPAAGQFRGQGTWHDIGEIGCPVEDWEWNRTTGYLPTHEGDEPPSDDDVRTEMLERSLRPGYGDEDYDRDLVAEPSHGSGYAEIAGATVEEMAEAVTLTPHPGWVGVFTRDNAPGAWPAGTQVVKIAEDEGGDVTALGTRGVVLGSIAMKDVFDGQPLYFVEWVTSPKRAFACIMWKLAKAEG